MRLDWQKLPTSWQSVDKLWSAVDFAEDERESLTYRCAARVMARELLAAEQLKAKAREAEGRVADLDRPLELADVVAIAESVRFGPSFPIRGARLRLTSAGRDRVSLVLEGEVREPAEGAPVKFSVTLDLALGIAPAEFFFLALRQLVREVALGVAEHGTFLNGVPLRALAES